MCSSTRRMRLKFLRRAMSALGLANICLFCGERHAISVCVLEHILAHLAAREMVYEGGVVDLHRCILPPAIPAEQSRTQFYLDWRSVHIVSTVQIAIVDTRSISCTYFAKRFIRGHSRSMAFIVQLVYNFNLARMTHHWHVFLGIDAQHIHHNRLVC